MRILAISGSLRVASSNTALVRAVAALSTDSIAVDVYDGLADVPPFNPDLDEAVVNALADAMDDAWVVSS